MDSYFPSVCLRDSRLTDGTEDALCVKAESLPWLLCPACLDLPLNLPQSDCEETADANGPRELTALYHLSPQGSLFSLKES